MPSLLKITIVGINEIDQVNERASIILKLELKINQLSKALNNSRVISADDLDGSSVTILCKVTIKNKKNGAEMTYQLVSESTADLKQKKISVTSPIGKALLGKAVGDIAEVQTPGGILEFEIINISL